MCCGYTNFTIIATHAGSAWVHCGRIWTERKLANSPTRNSIFVLYDLFLFIGFFFLFVHYSHHCTSSDHLSSQRTHDGWWYIGRDAILFSTSIGTMCCYHRRCWQFANRCRTHQVINICICFFIRFYMRKKRRQMKEEVDNQNFFRIRWTLHKTQHTFWIGFSLFLPF